jgi:hypothetical protein
MFFLVFLPFVILYLAKPEHKRRVTVSVKIHRGETPYLSPSEEAKHALESTSVGPSIESDDKRRSFQLHSIEGADQR